MDSNVGLAIQCIGISLVAFLSFFMMRFLPSPATKYWTIAWTCLALSLMSLLAGFQVPGAARYILYSIYFLGEYSFGLLFIAGCRNHARGALLEQRHLRALAPFVVLAAVLPATSSDFNSLFIVHAGIMAGLFAGAFVALRPARMGHTSPGVKVMSTALFLLMLDFLHYVPVFGSHQGAWGLPIPESYFKYTSILDLILEILLGFGTMIVLMEGVRREVEAANAQLTIARDRLEQIARIDPLTEALNRHAFDSLFSNSDKAMAGCVAVIDVDNLKPINDTYGHATGDASIRAVARAVRTLTRADDMLFRWGGDEFLVLMFFIPESRALERLDSLNSLLAKTRLPNIVTPVPITVSFGLSSFDTLAGLQQAIERADVAMYKSKQANKSQTMRAEI